MYLPLEAALTEEPLLETYGRSVKPTTGLVQLLESGMYLCGVGSRLPIASRWTGVEQILKDSLLGMEPHLNQVSKIFSTLIIQFSCPDWNWLSFFLS